jgi:hypothetical protein
MKMAPNVATLVGVILAVFSFSHAEGASRLTRLTNDSDGETQAQIVAVKVRGQGYYCDGPLSAEKDRENSAPNTAVWILKCWNGAYRVTLVPDMAAHIEHLN